MHKSIWNAFRLLPGAVIGIGLSMPGLHAQNYPVKPLRMLVGIAAGGGTDTVARTVAQKLPDYLGQPVIVENRTGAGGSIANERVATSPPDGYTLLLISSSAVILPALRTNLPYDMERDFAAVSLVAGNGAYVLVVHPSVPARNLKELIALARANPGKMNYGTAGAGTSTHLAPALFISMAKLNLTHVPFKGGSEFVTATAGGQVDLSFATVTSALPLMQGAKVKPLAVTSGRRTSLMPSIPTLDEAGVPGYEYSNWYGILAPKGVPANITARLHTAIEQAVRAPEMKEAMNRLGVEPQSNTPEQFAVFLRGELSRTAKLIKLTGAKED